MAGVGHFLGRVGRRVVDSGADIANAAVARTVRAGRLAGSRISRLAGDIADNIAAAPSRAKTAINRGIGGIQGFVDDVHRGFSVRMPRA